MLPSFRLDTDTEPDVRSPGDQAIDGRDVFRSFREHLKGVSVSHVHDFEHIFDEACGHVLVEQVGHRVDKDKAWPLPSEGVIEDRFVDGYGESILVFLQSH